ncbi:hypothetical protein niasHT_032169 [Heterodera trifolii]|uniref:SLC26A/SulP transporter domain-containing protein n=1 Tax=Heterodera trifolii TaxID=157864 RepID=A0ABD2HQV7_9BILA
MDIFPFFDRLQLGPKLALISPSFNALVEKHIDGISELPLLRPMTIRKDIGMPKLFVDFGLKSVQFPLPDRPLPKKIRFNDLHIEPLSPPKTDQMNAKSQAEMNPGPSGQRKKSGRRLHHRCLNARVRGPAQRFVCPPIRRFAASQRSGVGYLFMKLYDTASNINRANAITLALSFSSITFLLVGKEFLNPLLKRRLRLHIPLPFELFTVLIMTTVAQLFHLHSRYGVDIVGKIPTGSVSVYSRNMPKPINLVDQNEPIKSNLTYSRH